MTRPSRRGLLTSDMLATASPLAGSPGAGMRACKPCTARLATPPPRPRSVLRCTILSTDGNQEVECARWFHTKSTLYPLWDKVADAGA
jgi:hypothetical protein